MQSVIAQVSSAPQILGLAIGVLLAIVIAAVLLAYVAVPVARGIYLFIAHLVTFVWRTFADIVRAAGSLLLSVLYIPLVLGSIIIGRWSAAQHYGSAMMNEIGAMGLCFYRVIIGNPARLFMMQGLTEGIEKRLPAVMAAAPTSDYPQRGADLHNAATAQSSGSVFNSPGNTPGARRGQFDGYNIVGSLPSGGSGAKLYIAEPDTLKSAAFGAAGIAVEQVVIKSFSLEEGSSLPQIVRESRSLDAAKRMGLILDHELGSDKFYYVMRYVPGESLTLITKQLHATSETPPAGTPSGLSGPQLSAGIGYALDLVATLAAYHKGGLWHKDVKPDNIIVATRSDRRAHLVDFGLVSSLRSAMTLTTHGTEYFRDPELVRRALRGVKVHEVDGTKFDIYAAGAVLYSIIEDSFPAHGVLSQYNKRCPEAVKWVIRRSMTDYDKRYSSAVEMLTDLQYITQAADPFKVKPFELPSTREEVVPPPLPQQVNDVNINANVQDVAQNVNVAYAGAQANNVTPAARNSPRIRVTNWWSGQVVVEGQDGKQQIPPVNPFATPQGKQVVDAGVAAASTASIAAQQLAAQAVAAAQHAFRTPVKAQAGDAAPSKGRRPLVDVTQRKSASEQIAAAQARAAAAQERAASRSSRGRGVETMARYKSGMSGGVAVALCALAGTIIGVGALMSTRSQESATGSYVVTYEDGSPSTHGGPAMDESAAFESADFDPRTVVTTGDCRILLMNDIKQPYSSAQSQWLTSLMNKLRDANITVMGEAPGTRELDETELSMIASLRVALGTTPLDGAQTPQRVCGWLASQNNGPTEILWVQQLPSNENPTIVRFRCDNRASCEDLADALR